MFISSTILGIEGVVLDFSSFVSPFNVESHSLGFINIVSVSGAVGSVLIVLFVRRGDVCLLGLFLLISLSLPVMKKKKELFKLFLFVCLYLSTSKLFRGRPSNNTPHS